MGSARRFACTGEILLRLGAPRGELLLQSPRLETSFGGAEANVAVALAHFGHSALMVSAVPDHAIGAAAIADLARHGVDTRFVARTPGRQGFYYLEPGAGLRPASVIYDRADSCFALWNPEPALADAALQSVDWLHLSGVTPALGSLPGEFALQLASRARQADLQISFDTNFRAKLWGTRAAEAPAVLRRFAADATLLFADRRMLLQLLGEPADAVADGGDDAFTRAASAAFARWPRLQSIANTVRQEHSVEHHELRGILATRVGTYLTRTWQLPAIVERIGSGDAFAAGILHGLATSLAPQQTIDFAVAAACLKHYVAGDACLASVSDVQQLLAGDGFGVRR